VLLRSGWLPLGIALLLVGYFAESGPLLGLGLFVLLAGGLSRLWADRALDRVTFERLLPETRSFPGETIRLTYRLTNAKAVPLPRLEMRDQLPEELSPAGMELKPSGNPGTNSYHRTTHLAWNERVRWSLDLPCPRRGYYRLGPARLRSGDGFGLFVRERDEPDMAGIVVYPRTRALSDLGLPAVRPLGERRGRARIFEDPLRIAGLRDYEPGDSLRRIDWKATARRGRLQSRVYEPSATQLLVVALNVDTTEHSWEGYVPPVLEASIAAAGSIAQWAHQSGYAVGLLANGSLPESSARLVIPPARSPDQLLRILEALGGIEPMTMVSLSDLVEREGPRLPVGATFAVVTSLMPEALAAALQRRRARGQEVVVISMVEADWPDLLGAIPVRHIAVETMVEEGAPL
jgi:uncharacterized protein (DUF58 family)